MPVTNLRNRVNTLVEWFPVVGLLTALGEAKSGAPQVMAALQLLQFAAAKTPLQQDDELLRLLENIVLTEQGRALIEYLSTQIASLLEQSNVSKPTV
jgi:hypothetical protein